MTRAALLTSVSNPLVKRVRSAVAHGRPTEDGLAVAETFHLLEDALRAGLEVPAVLVTEAAQAEAERLLAGRAGVRVGLLAGDVFDSIGSVETSQGVIALVRPPEFDLEVMLAAGALVVVLEGIQDPGNAGAIARAAEAFGATGLISTRGTVHLYNPKALRASAGSLFRLPHVQSLPAPMVKAALAHHGIASFATVPYQSGYPAPEQADLVQSCALLIGNEARGLSAALRDGAIEMAIPTRGVESLNAAVAAGVLLYEARRQRDAA